MKYVGSFRCLALIFVIVLYFELYEVFFRLLDRQTRVHLLDKSFTINMTTTIFCFILTYPKHFETFTKVSYENCFKHCTDYRFVTVYDKKVEGLPYKFLHPNNWPKESYKLITNKIFNGFIQTSTFPAYDWYPN